MMAARPVIQMIGDGASRLTSGTSGAAELEELLDEASLVGLDFVDLRFLEEVGGLPSFSP
jgi:hypothetical protein